MYIGLDGPRAAPISGQPTNTMGEWDLKSSPAFVGSVKQSVAPGPGVEATQRRP